MWARALTMLSPNQILMRRQDLSSGPLMVDNGESGTRNTTQPSSVFCSRLVLRKWLRLVVLTQDVWRSKQPELENPCWVAWIPHISPTTGLWLWWGGLVVTVYPAFIPLNIKNGAYALLKSAFEQEQIISRDTFTDGSVKCTMTSMTASEPVVSLAVSPFSKDSGNKYVFPPTLRAFSDWWMDLYKF
ncbi:hypothetical protein Tco_0072255 [Tanacetum coccineum]